MSDSARNCITRYSTSQDLIEVYAGKAVEDSLCNFALDLRAPKELLERPGHKGIERLSPDWKPEPEYPAYFMPLESRKTIIAKRLISNRRTKSVSFLPTYISRYSQPEVLLSQDQRFGEVIGYIEEITGDQGLETKYNVQGDEVIVHQ